ncbi:MAG: hypothetical protein ACTTKL_06680 [Treponema sp.]
MNRKRRIDAFGASFTGCFMGKGIIAAILAVFGCVSVHAGSLAFQIVQHGGGFSEVAESSLIIEDEVMNTLFDAGFIVSNIPAALSSSQKDDERLFLDGKDEAQANSFDTFVSIHLFFKNQAVLDGKKAKLSNMSEISWKIAGVKSGVPTAEGSKAIEKSKSGDSEAAVRDFARNFALNIRKMLKA